jgi:hypothetical protein
MLRRLLSANGAPLGAFLAGGCVFLATVGWVVLAPGHVGWVARGDAATTYLGWLFFRGEPWHFPLGVIAGYGDGLGANIISTDSVPIAALLFKPLHALLPEPFQYFGLWLALGFSLQGLFAALILRNLRAPPTQQLLGAVLVVMTPFMILRATEYFGLASQWEILAAIYLYQHDARRARTMVAWIGLLAVTSLTHAYLFALVGSVWAAALLQSSDGTPAARKVLLAHAVIAIALVSLLMGLVGYAALAPSASTGGFGQNQLNLLGWINPRGLGRFLPELPLANADQGEGIQYLGAGTLLVCFTAIIGWLARRRASVLPIRRWTMLLVVAGLWLAFAVSHRITIGPVLLLEVPLPRLVLDAAGIFRASGRMAWLAAYVVMLAAIATCALRFPRLSIPLLAIACLLQWADIAPLRHSFDRFASEARGGNPADCGPLSGPRMPVTVLPEVRIYGYDTHKYWDLAVCAGRRALPINSAYVARNDEARYLANAIAVDHAMTHEPPRKDRYYAYRNEAVPAVLGLPAGFGSRVGEFRVFSGGDALAALSRRDAGEAATARRTDSPWSFRLETKAAGIAPDYLLSGWSNLDGNGVWTDGPIARVLIPVPAGYASLTALRIFGLAYGANGRQSIDVSVNGTAVGHWEFKSLAAAEWRSVQVPAQAFRGHDGYAVIEFRIERPAMPQSVTVSDRRKLGLYLSEIRLESLFNEWPPALTFDDKGNGVALLDAGWSSPEPWGTWSDGDVAVIRIASSEKSRPTRLRFLVQASSPTGTQRTTVRIDGHDVAVWTIPSLSKPEWHELELPAAHGTSEAPLLIEFVPGTPGPPPVPGSTDQRRLGIGLMRIER